MLFTYELIVLGLRFLQHMEQFSESLGRESNASDRTHLHERNALQLIHSIFRRAEDGRRARMTEDDNDLISLDDLGLDLVDSTTGTSSIPTHASGN